MKNHIPKASFFKAFSQKIVALRSASPPATTARSTGGRKPRVSVRDLIAGLAWHVLQPVGTFSHHFALFIGLEMSDSALSERRQSLGTAPWLNALEVFLEPHADQKIHPHAFYQGLRLVGIDGTTMNVANTPSIKASTVKTKTRRGKSAFYRIGNVAAVELGTHSPIALRIGEKGESEGALAATIVDVFGKDDLIIGDRYYGNGKNGARLLALPKKPKFLVRVQERFKAVTVKKLKDGSKLVKVKNPDTGEDILLREIKAKVRRPGKSWVKIRLWTNLLDPIKYPAKELVPLYGMRWEQEIAFREIKEHLHDSNVLLSHTVVTAVQEICALFMAQSIVSNARLTASNGQNIPFMQISFAKTLDACRNLCWLWAIGGNILSAEQFREIAHLMENELAKQASKKRRKRSCPRKVRQPITKWPRLLTNQYEKGEFTYEIRK